MTWKSFGEAISISIQNVSPETVSIRIKSEPAVKTTLVDYGKNYQNVEAIIDYLEALIVRKHETERVETEK